MNRYLKLWPEIAIGFSLSLLFFLAYLGLNIWPIVIAGCGVGLLAFVAKKRGISGTFGGGFGQSMRSRRMGKSGVPQHSFEDIGGQMHAKQELMEALDFLVKPELIHQFGIRPLKGVLLTGPPGTGKTLMAKAAAHYADAVFVGATGSEFVEMYVGVGASRIRKLFQDARALAKKENKSNAILFIDEIDVIGGKREGGQQKEYDQTLNQLLTEMDGLYADEYPRILVMAATNRKEMLDGALLRPGRFDRLVQVELPDKKGREQVLHIHARNKPLAGDVQLSKVADETYGFSGAQLESVLNEAAIYAMREQQTEIGSGHLSMAIDKVLMGEKLDRESNEEERKRVALHELGHAIMAEIVRPGSVSQVSLHPRGQALGYVRHQPQQEHYIYTLPFLEDQIMIALGGAAAEEMFYGHRSTGSKGDFEQALSIAETMVNCGLTRLGIVKSSQVSNEKLSGMMNEILEALMKRTKMHLEKHEATFHKALEQLNHEEQMDGDTFRCLFYDKKHLPV